MFPQEATGEELLMEGIKSEKKLLFKYVDDFEESSECYTKMAIIAKLSPNSSSNWARAEVSFIPN